MKPEAIQPADRDIAGSAAIADTGSIEMGTVGWDTGEYLDQGSTSNDGNTLVAVQLYRGRDPATPLKPGVAQGHRIWCQVSSHCGFTIPLKGTRVQVSIPAGMREIHGAPLITGIYDTGVAMHGNLGGGETCIAGMGGQARALFKASGSACLYTTQSNSPSGQSCTVQVNPDGSCVMAGPFGGFSTSVTAAGLAFRSTSGVQCDGNGAWLTGPAIGLSSGNVQLGPAPTHGIVLGDLLATQHTAINTFLTALTAYTTAIQLVADPTNVATPVLQTAITVCKTALLVTNFSGTCKASS